MQIYKINGLTIKFPFKPYDSQIEIITNLTKSLLNKETCLIESPTGTGKSISILSSVLPYLKECDEKVYLCTRTHKQIEQLVKQLKSFVISSNLNGNLIKATDKKTVINTTNATNATNTTNATNATNTITEIPLKMAILGSRTILCINKEVRSSTDINRGCSDLVKHNKCVYFTNHGLAVKKFRNQLFDLEDLIDYSKKNKCCPYFASKSLSEKANLVFSPYNYVLDPFIRRRFNINNSNIIIDEAHNLEDLLRDIGSVSINRKEINEFIKEILGLREKEVLPLIEFLKGLATIFEDLNPSKKIKSNENYNNKELDYKNNYKELDYKNNYKELDYKNNYKELENNTVIIREKELNILFKKYFNLIQINGYKNIIYNLDKEIELTCYNKLELLLFIITIIITENKYILSVDPFALKILLIDVSVLFNALIKNNLSVILLSGTIGDIPFFEKELKHKFINKAITSHVVKKENIFVRKVISFRNKEIIGTLINTNDGYFKEICFMIEELYKVTKGGVLVFLSSYSLINRIKPFLKCKHFNEEDINLFKREAESGKALLLCVYRGRMAEGIDFRDRLCRLVIGVGIPYPSLGDVVVKIKKESQGWYENQALKAVNQAIGRVIRHAEDYGAVVLLDSRYRGKRMAKWVEENLVVSGFEKCLEEYVKWVGKSDGLIR